MKFLATLFTIIVNLLITCNNFLHFKQWVLQIPKEGYTHGTYWCDRKKKNRHIRRHSDPFCNLDGMPYTITSCKTAPFTLQMEQRFYHKKLYFFMSWPYLQLICYVTRLTLTLFKMVNNCLHVCIHPTLKYWRFQVLWKSDLVI